MECIFIETLTITSLAMVATTGYKNEKNIIEQYKVEFDSKTLILYSSNIFTGLGGQGLFLNTIEYKDIFDVYLGGPLRCNECNSQSKSYDNEKCDSVLFEIRTNNMKDLPKINFNIYPNPFENELFLILNQKNLLK